MLLVIATVGTTIAPWMQFFVQSNIVDKGVTAKELASARRRHRAARSSANIVACFIIVTTGTVLYPRASDHRRRAGRRGARAVAGELRDHAVRGRAASALAARRLRAAADRGYAICEAFGWERGIDRMWSEAPVFNGIYTFVIVFGAALVLIPGARSSR